MTPERLAQIRRFHEVLTVRLQTDKHPITGIERAAVISIMAELIEHAEGTVGP